MNVLFIDIDTLRPDHMGCYGYPRNTTPCLDRVAREGLRFDRCYCSDAPCLPSRAALTTGRFGIHTGAVGHSGTNADRRLTGKTRGFSDPADNHNFHNLFRQAGLFTASISTFPERHSSWWFSAGFHETYNVGGRGGESGEEVLPVALDWLDRHGDAGNWYLHVHLWDPHTPYRAPESFGNPFADEPLCTFVDETVLQTHLKHVGPHCLNEFNMYDDQEYPQYPRYPGKATDMAGVRKILDGYDCGVAYADYIVGRILDDLRRRCLYDDTAILITSDHGENMGEFGIYGEHATADHPTCHVPLILKWPGGRRGMDDGLHYTLDLVPTVAELLGLPAWEKWDGESFAPAVAGKQDAGRPYLVLSQMAHVCQRSVREGDWLYIRTYHDGFHLFDREMLFNLREDPYEQRDLKDENPAVTAQLAKRLLDWTDDQMMVSDTVSDPLWEVMKEGGPSHTRGFLPNYLKRLEATGRAEGARLLRQRHGDGTQ